MVISNRNISVLVALLTANPELPVHVQTDAEYSWDERHRTEDRAESGMPPVFITGAVLGRVREFDTEPVEWVYDWPGAIAADRKRDLLSSASQDAERLRQMPDGSVDAAWDALDWTPCIIVLSRPSVG